MSKENILNLIPEREEYKETQVDEIREREKRNRLAELNRAIKRFISAGLIAGSLWSSYPIEAQELSRYHQGVTSTQSLQETGQERKSQRITAEDFDKDFAFEYSELEKWGTTEKELELLFGPSLDMKEAQYFREDLTFLKKWIMSNESQPQSHRTNINNYKLRFESKFYPHGIDEKKKVDISGPIEINNHVINYESLRSLIDAFPENWINGKVYKIVQTETSQNGNIEGLPSINLALFSPGDRSIELLKMTKYQDAKTLFYVLAHESGHANDWRSDSNTSYEEKLELLLKISKRIKAENRFNSNYTEALSSDGKSGRSSYILAKEYWAEICSQYFIDSTQLAIEDFEIVDEWVKKGDREFDHSSFVAKKDVSIQKLTQQVSPKK